MSTKPNLSQATNIDIPISMIHVEQDFNVREHIDIDSLKEEIRDAGVLRRLLVGPPMADGRYSLIDGHRRLTAVKKLISEGVPMDTVPAEVLKDEVSWSDRYFLMLHLNNGEKLTMYEMGHAFSRIRQSDPTITESYIADKYGISQAHVNRCLRLFTFSTAEMREDMKSGKLPHGPASQVVASAGIVLTDEPHIVTEKVSNAYDKYKHGSELTDDDIVGTQGKKTAPTAELEVAPVPADTPDIIPTDKSFQELKETVEAETFVRGDFVSQASTELQLLVDYIRSKTPDIEPSNQFACNMLADIVGDVKLLLRGDMERHEFLNKHVVNFFERLISQNTNS